MQADQEEEVFESGDYIEGVEEVHSSLFFPILKMTIQTCWRRYSVDFFSKCQSTQTQAVETQAIRKLPVAKFSSFFAFDTIIKILIHYGGYIRANSDKEKLYHNDNCLLRSGFDTDEF